MQAERAERRRLAQTLEMVGVACQKASSRPSSAANSLSGNDSRIGANWKPRLAAALDYDDGASENASPNAQRRAGAW